MFLRYTLTKTLRGSKSTVYNQLFYFISAVSAGCIHQVLLTNQFDFILARVPRSYSYIIELQHPIAIHCRVSTPVAILLQHTLIIYCFAFWASIMSSYRRCIKVQGVPTKKTN